MAADPAPDSLLKITIACPDAAVAESLARHLVAGRLAACVHVSKVQSVYTWEGQTEVAGEVLLEAKTTWRRRQDVADAVAERHPYDVPEVVGALIPFATDDYAEWVRASVTPKAAQDS